MVRVAGDGSTVSVMGGVKAPGVYPIQAPTLRLSSMLAPAGGVDVVPDVAQIKVERARPDRAASGSRTSTTTRAWTWRCAPGDRIIVEEDRRSFTALGATTAPGARAVQHAATCRRSRRSPPPAASTARAANPTGVFVFRDEPADVANRVLGRTDLVGQQRMAYLLDFTRPEGLFAAGDFVIRDDDTIYVTEAALGSWTRIIALAATAAALVRTVDVISQ